MWNVPEQEREREETGKRGRADRSGADRSRVINDSSAARGALASSSYAADLGLMSCNKTWPSTPEIGPLAVMLSSSLPHQHTAFIEYSTSNTYKYCASGTVGEDDEVDDEDDDEDKERSQGSMAAATGDEEDEM